MYIVSFLLFFKKNVFSFFLGCSKSGYANNQILTLGAMSVFLRHFGKGWLLTAGLYRVLTLTLLSGLDTDVHFSGFDMEMPWEDYLFELQNAVEWRMVMSRSADERPQMHAVSMLLNTCEDMTNRALINTGGNWIQQGNEQEQRTELLVGKLSTECCWPRQPLDVRRSS